MPEFLYPSSEHEKKITKHFGNTNLLLDTNPTKKNKLAVIICFTNRSGSNLLAEYLSMHPKIGVAKEYFNYEDIERNSKQQDFETFEHYYQFVLEKQIENDVFVTKLSPFQMFFMLGTGLFEKYFEKVKIIYISRRDLVKQAVSFFVAFQNKQWTALMKPITDEVAYDGNKIYSIMENIAKNNMYMELYMNITNNEVYRTCYEDFIGNEVDICNEIFKFLELEENQDIFRNFEPRLSKQVDSIKETYYQKFKSFYHQSDSDYIVPFDEDELEVIEVVEEEVNVVGKRISLADRIKNRLSAFIKN